MAGSVKTSALARVTSKFAINRRIFLEIYVDVPSKKDIQMIARDFKHRLWWPQNQFASELQLQRWTYDYIFCESVTTKLSYLEVLTFL